MDHAAARREARNLLQAANQLGGDDAIALLNQHVARNYGLLLQDPIVAAQGPWLQTRSGRRLFDGVAAYSAANLGHGHVLVKETLKLFLDSNAPTVLGRFLPDPWLALFGRKVTQMTGFDRFLPANGGVEGPEAAIKLARRWAHKVKGVRGTPEILYADHCFHGRTLTVTQMFDPDEKAAVEGFGPWPAGFRRVAYDDLAAMEAAITPDTAAILVEPIQGEGGVNVPKPGYLRGLKELGRKHNVLVILDEVQTGWARTGELFCWMHEGEPARPDILCIGKSVSGGFAPVGGILADARLMDLLGPGSHGSTFGGCPISSAIAVAALTAIEQEKLVDQAREKGPWVMERLRQIAKDSPRIHQLRGKGLMFGIELTRDGPDGHAVAEKLVEAGLILKDTHRWILRFTPPIVASREELEFALEAMARVLAGAPTAS
ncbi:MAG: aspartate aminotransferase family protein [Planctomycetes bacterium]|jgi:ornithine--oxo-acid transaminase|nr:aspartate aminotransferase family protein [Planctomycetota bacterium]MCL4731316.1 aminotransferase class III-fold pyridoxal phosphate-dependent enzyme [Planctomycetota bacterium]